MSDLEPTNLIKANFKQRNFKECEHTSLLVGDHGDDSVTCATCKKDVLPFDALRILCRSETRLRYRYEENKKVLEKIEAKKRVKCRHCWKMTEVLK